jgi:uncharacterized protein YndB with AHSA1/START domain
MTDTNKIEKELLLRAPKARVWRALTDSSEFGTWFGMKFDAPFEPGGVLAGKMTIKGYEHLSMDLAIDRISPEDYFSYRWHPYAVEQNIDYSKEPMTLVEFRLADAPEGTVLKITESGFDKIPEARRDLAFRMNDGGWNGQMKNIQRYVEA